jgi:hypothetical protein
LRAKGEPLVVPTLKHRATGLCLAGGLCRTGNPNRDEKIPVFATSKMTAITIDSPRLVHVFCNKKIAIPASKSRRFPPKSRNQASGKPEAHHKPPQIPKSHFIHSKVVRPQLLT